MKQACYHYTKGSKEIIELASEAERLAKHLHPRDEEAAERHAVDAFLSALDRPLAAEVRKLGQNHMEGNGMEWNMFFGPKAQHWDRQGHSAPKKRKMK